MSLLKSNSTFLPRLTIWSKTDASPHSTTVRPFAQRFLPCGSDRGKCQTRISEISGVEPISMICSNRRLDKAWRFEKGASGDW